MRLNGQIVALYRDGQIILNDLDWLRWQRPEDTDNYIILWLFHNNPKVIVNLKGSVVDPDNLQHTLVRIEVDPEDSGMLKLLENPPFGQIKILSRDLIDNKEHIKFEWIYSNALSTNPKLMMFPANLVIKIQACMNCDDKEWIIKINDKWTTKSDFYSKYFEILEVNMDSLTISRYTVHGPKTEVLNYNTEYVLSYINVN